MKDRAQEGIPSEGPEDRDQRREIRNKQADEFGGKYSEEKSPIASLRGGITDCLTPFALFAHWLSSSANRRLTSFLYIVISKSDRVCFNRTFWSQCKKYFRDGMSWVALVVRISSSSQEPLREPLRLGLD